MNTNLEIQVLEFIAKQCAVDQARLAPKTTLFGDLGIDGGEGNEVVCKFAEKNHVDISNFVPSKHFGPESVVPWAPFYWIILALRKGSPEDRARLLPIRIQDMFDAAKSGKWPDFGNNRLKVDGLKAVTLVHCDTERKVTPDELK